MIYVVLKHEIAYQVKMPSMQNSCCFCAVPGARTIQWPEDPGGSLIHDVVLAHLPVLIQVVLLICSRESIVKKC